jgi:predicted metal-dependent peptidase
MLSQLKSIDQRQTMQWDETRAALTMTSPHFTHLFYTLMDNTGNKARAFFTLDVPVAATDSKVILLNPANYFPRPLGERLFILAHELMHNVFNDVVFLHYCHSTNRVVCPGGELPFNEELLQISMDLRINDLLVETGLGTMPPDGWHNKDLGTWQESVVTIYERLYQKCSTKGPGKGKDGKGQGGVDPGKLGTGRGKGGDKGEGFDIVLEPGESGIDSQTPGEAAQERQNKQEQWDREIKIGMELARTQGRLPAQLNHIFGELIEHKVPWQEHLQADIARTFGGGSYNWKRPDRSFIVRDIYVPGRSSFACDCVAVGGDTSGSITDEEIDRTMSECMGILELLRPERIILMWCDAAIGRVDVLTDPADMAAIREKGAPGRGGTDFRPVFEYLEAEGIEPDALIYFTDGAGTFPDREPPYPVIWGQLLPNEPVQFPFGKVVEIPRGAK